jgi:hypothetical protein
MLHEIAKYNTVTLIKTTEMLSLTVHIKWFHRGGKPRSRENISFREVIPDIASAGNQGKEDNITNGASSQFRWEGRSGKEVYGQLFNTR